MAVSTVGSNALGLYLKIVSQNGVYSQLSENCAGWKNILKRKKSPGEGRERRYLLRSAFGSAAAAFVGVNGDVAYPNAHKATLAEALAYYKDFALTVEVERAVLARALGDMGKYGEPLAEEIKCKTIAMSRMLSAALYQDGTGVIGYISTVVIASGKLTIVLDTADSTNDRSHIGWFEYGDKIKFANTAGTAKDINTATHSYYAITAVDRENDTVTVASYTSAGVLVTIGSGDIDTLAAGNVIYRSGSTPIDLTAISSTTEYGTLTSAFVGFPTLFAADNRKIHNINMTGPIKGTQKDVGGLALDSQHFQQLVSLQKVAVGEGTYKWNSATMAPEVLDALVESRETDRRFTSIQDNKKGVAALGYVHGKDTLMFETDEFTPKKRSYVIPGGDVLQFFGSEFDWVRPEGGSKFFLKPSDGGHYRTVRAYMEGSGLLTCVHPQACGVLKNFTA